MKVPHVRYKVIDFYGNEDWHTVNYKREEYPISTETPFPVIIGETTQINSIVYGENCTKIKSNWFWRYNFNSANYSNYWGSSSIGCNGTTYVSDLGLGISNSTWYSIGNSNTVVDAYVTSGSNGEYITKLSRVHFSGYHDYVFEPSITYASAAANRGFVCLFKSYFVTDLPSNMYSIFNNTITWYDTPILRLLRGKLCTPYS